tara:strand:- start:802 stop:1035 length:234 start_codon:yes stop_codon:yes gene_type:complete
LLIAAHGGQTNSNANQQGHFVGSARALPCLSSIKNGRAIAGSLVSSHGCNEIETLTLQLIKDKEKRQTAQMPKTKKP